MMVYKGFHGRVECVFEYVPSNLVYGKKDGDFMQVTSIVDSLMKLGKALNIRQHPIKGRIIGDVSNPDIYLSQNMLIYRLKKISTDEIIANKKREAKENRNTMSNVIDFTQNLNSGVNDKGDGIYVVMNAESIFPIDVEIFKKSKQLKRQRLRPEFLKEYKKKLNPDTMQEDHQSRQLEQNDFELTEANKELNNEFMSHLVNGLDSMEFLPMDSPGLERVFHEFGVNMRYLG